jgi:RIO kinase 1
LREYDSSSDSHPEPARRRRRRFDDDDEPRARHRRPDLTRPDLTAIDGRGDVEPDGPPEGDRWSTWDGAEHGPDPRPGWVVTEHAAVDTELGVIKTGKEADVHLVERAVPGTDRRTLLAAKRYRTAEHRMFHRDAGYLEGRRVKESRMNRAIDNRTDFGRELIAGQWSAAEFSALCRMYSAGVPVPYPVQIVGTELLLEFVGSPDGTAAPRVAEVRRDADLDDLWFQLVETMHIMAQAGFAHGDLSAYNLLVHDGRLVVIDLPQIVDVVANPQGGAFLARDVRRIGDWFASRGLPSEVGSAEMLLEELRVEAGMPPTPRTSQG